MDRNSDFLNIGFVGVLMILLVSCLSDQNDKENILNIQDYNPNLKEAVGKYYFVPIKDEFLKRDDYKYLKLKKGDTLFLEIKKDSTYTFNKFYYNQGNHINNLTGKLIRKESAISFSPNLDINDATIYLIGFKKSKKTGLYFYYGINGPTDPTEFEYYISYKKLK